MQPAFFLTGSDVALLVICDCLLILFGCRKPTKFKMVLWHLMYRRIYHAYVPFFIKYKTAAIVMITAITPNTNTPSTIPRITPTPALDPVPISV